MEPSTTGVPGQAANPSAAGAVQQTPPAATPQTGRGTLLFSRSADAPSTRQDQPRAASETAPAALAASITDAMRAAPTLTDYDFTIHLQPGTAALEAQVLVTIRNDGTAPLATLPLQLSSTLHFNHVRMGTTLLAFVEHPLASDADHTGSLTEAAIVLPAPLAPGGRTTLTISYEGTISPSTGRLDRLGAPAAVALRSDWDRISEGFTGLRGFGDSVWYPVASVPALLGDGNQLFHEIGRQKQQNRTTRVSMAVTAEFTGGAPNVAILDGHTVPLDEPASLPTAGFPGIVRVALPATPLGFDTPSLVLATRIASFGSQLVAVHALPAHAAAAPSYTAAASLLEPLYRDWLGAQPPSPLQLIDLPMEDASPAQDGDALLLSLSGGPPSQLAESLNGPLAHAYFHSPRPWLREGVAGLMQVLWTERTEGREKALQQLGSGRVSLALVEPATPGSAGGQPLIAAEDAIFYRAKATDVLWMLRSIAGDAALSAALRAYNPAQDTAPDYFEHLVEQAARMQQAQLNGQATTDPGTARAGSPTGTPAAGGAGEAGNDQAEPGLDGRDLTWFFKNWVYEDPGLPDLSITNVYSSRTGAGDQWLVAVNLSNAGYAEAEVPVVVHSASTSVVTLVRIPARGTLSRRILLLGEPTEVDLNDGSVPEIIASAHQRKID